MYRVSKFVRRHRMGVSIAVGLALVLVVFASTMTLQARRISRERDRANREAQVAKQISDYLVGLFNISDPGEARGNTLTAREILDKGAREIDRTLRDQPQVQGRLQATMGSVYTNLGLYTVAEPLLQQAVATETRAFGIASPETLATMNALANVYW